MIGHEDATRVAIYRGRHSVATLGVKMLVTGVVDSFDEAHNGPFQLGHDGANRAVNAVEDLSHDRRFWGVPLGLAMSIRPNTDRNTDRLLTGDIG